MKIESKTQTLDPKEEVNESENLPEEVQPVEQPSVDETARKLELENAELRGKVNAFETISKLTPQNTQPNQQDAWKSIALNDLNVLNDDEFQVKYKNSKLQVNSAILQHDFSQETSKQKQQYAELRAENTLLSKHPDFFDYKDAVKEALNDVSPEVKQDPERLSKVMERAYLAAAKTAPKKGETMDRRSITSSNFERPQPRKDLNANKNYSDEIPEEHRKVCNAFGITSEKERKQLMESDDVETHFGNGIVFRDRTKGFEKIA